LEGRALLSTASAAQPSPYVLSGFKWANPSHITYSIAPDGVVWDHGINDLNAVFNAKFGAGKWEREIARVFATWQSVANINISPTSDSANDFDVRGAAQGDPRFGDIRFGGYAFGSTTTLAQTTLPPPNGSTAAGDVEVNTTMNFNIGSDYDFYSVMLHETGHSLGLEHSGVSSDVLYARYQGVVSGLTPGAIAGIQALYGARTQDSYQSQGQGLGFSSAIDVTPSLNGAGKASVSNVSLATIGSTEYFSVVAPAGVSGGFQVTAAASGVSMLSPKISLYDASGRLIASQSDPSSWSNNVTVSANGVTPGQRYYVAVTGATSDVFAVGGYTLNVSFGMKPTAPGNPTPVPDPPSTPVAPPTTPVTPPPVTPPPATSAPAPVVALPDRFEPNDTTAQATPLGTVNQMVILPGLSLTNGSDRDVFVFQNARAGVFYVGATGTFLRVYDAHGNTISAGVNIVGMQVLRARSTLYVEVSSPTGTAVPLYTLVVAPPAVATRPAVNRVTPIQPVAPPPVVNPIVSFPLAWARFRALTRLR